MPRTREVKKFFMLCFGVDGIFSFPPENVTSLILPATTIKHRESRENLFAVHAFNFVQLFCARNKCLEEFFFSKNIFAFAWFWITFFIAFLLHVFSLPLSTSLSQSISLSRYTCVSWPETFCRAHTNTHTSHVALT